MIYGLKIRRSWYICDTANKFAASYGPVGEKDAFWSCLEDYLQACDGRCNLPYNAAEAWTFWKADSQEKLLEDKGSLIVTLHADDKDALWQLKKWISGSCARLRIQIDY